MSRCLYLLTRPPGRGGESRRDPRPLAVAPARTGHDGASGRPVGGLSVGGGPTVDLAVTTADLIVTTRSRSHLNRSPRASIYRYYIWLLLSHGLVGGLVEL